eukprot:scaffold7918_cov165-Amphora_coffeaeformis.AAC.2
MQISKSTKGIKKDTDGRDAKDEGMFLPLFLMCLLDDGWRLAHEETSTGKIVYKKPLTLRIHFSSVRFRKSHVHLYLIYVCKGDKNYICHKTDTH